MPISPGARLGSYEVLSLLGAGGMGEVYKARDTRLDRTVAIKVLPSHLADKPQLRERFEREARTISSLNHPHICVLYDIGQQDGIHYLVMEYLEGETLADRINKGPLPLDQVLRYAIEIADALDKAHRQGVTHRDLKPGNIMLTKSGSKLLDFGLAKLRSETAPTVPFSQLPTAKDSLTVEGTILGTLQYMAPEQVEGKIGEIDARTDIFAFGAVIYEMATGKRAFEGKSATSVIAAILKDEPPSMSSLQPMTPPTLDRVVKRCLAKDADDRWQAARDLWHELKWIKEGGGQAAMAAVTEGKPPEKSRRLLLVGLACLVLGAVVASITGLNLRRSETPAAQSPKRFALSLPPNDQLVTSGTSGLALSPDGKTLVYVARRAGVAQLYRRSMDQFEASPIPGTEEAQSPFFSPDGQWVGFYAGGKLVKIPLGGGPPVALYDVTGDPRGGSWGSDETIVLGVGGSGLLRVSAAGGTAEQLTTLGEDEVQHAYPDILPGGQAVIFNILGGVGVGGLQNRIVVQSLETGERKFLLDGTIPRFVPTGHIIFVRAGTLWAVPFDANRLEVIGPPGPVGEGLQMTTPWHTNFEIARDGSLVYIPGAAFPRRRLVWVDRKGLEQPLNAPPRSYETPRLSPDGQRLALEIREENADVWTYDLARGSLTRLTFDPGEDEMPVWMPDGERIVFAGDRGGVRKIFSKTSDGSGTEEEVLGSQGGHLHSVSVSPDGKVLAYTKVSINSGIDIWVTTLHGDQNPTPYQQTEFAEQSPAFSPDGRWIAYMSNESGRNEIYLQAFPGPGGKWQISTEGGMEPVWARNGRELFYRYGGKMMAVDVTTQPTFSAGRPHVVFEGQYESIVWMVTNYDVSPDGQRFLMVEAAETETTQINVVLNWFEELKRRVPVGQ